MNREQKEEVPKAAVSYVQRFCMPRISMAVRLNPGGRNADSRATVFFEYLETKSLA